MIESEMMQNITVVMLKIRNETYLLDVGEVKEIYIPGDKIVPVPLANRAIIGIINIRDQIYSVISLRHLIYKDETDHILKKRSRLILTEISGTNIALLVDSVDGVRQLPISIFNLKNIIVETKIDYKFIDSVGVLNEETFILLDIKAIIHPFVLSMESFTETMQYPELRQSPIPKIKVSSEKSLRETLISHQKSKINKLVKQKVPVDNGLLLTEYQQDILKEIGNIGCGNAVTALSRLIKKKIEVNLTDVGFVSFDKLSKEFGTSKEKVCGIFCHIKKPYQSTILQVFDMKPLLSLIKSIAGKKSKIITANIKNKKDLDKYSISTITEMGNIMAGHYASAIGDLTGIKLMINVPEFTMSTTGEIGDFLATELKSLSEYVLIIKTSINIVDLKLNGMFFFIPSVDTLGLFFEKLGISVEESASLKRLPKKSTNIDINDIKLSEIQKDALKEVGNIGAGNAANALAKMIDKRVDINIPSVEMIELDVLADNITKKNEKLIVAWSNVTGKAKATVLTMFAIRDIIKLSSIIIEDDMQQKLSESKINSVQNFPEFYRSAIAELGHILASHYTSALGDLLMIRLMTEAPDISVDKGKQLFNILKDEVGILKKLSLVITTNVIIKDIKIVGTFLFIPDIETLHELLEALSKFFA